MRRGDLERDRSKVIAYHALWQLFEEDPQAEPAHFRRTRLDLHRWIDGDGQPLRSIAVSEDAVPAVQRLRLIPLQ